MYKYIKNPSTNNFVSINSNLGKSILKKYLNQLIGGSWELERQNLLLEDIVCLSSLDYFEIDNFDENSESESEVNDYIPTKKIILLGDVHIPCNINRLHLNKTSIYVDEFIMDIVDKCKSKNICLDLVIEKPLEKHQFKLTGGYYSSDIYKYNIDTLNFIRNLFNDCAKKNYVSDSIENCIINDDIYDNLRIHNNDIRFKSDDHKLCIWTEALGFTKDESFNNEKKDLLDSKEEILDKLYKWVLEGELNEITFDEIPPGFEDDFNDKFSVILEECWRMLIKINKEKNRYNSNKIYNISYSTIIDVFLKVKEELHTFNRYIYSKRSLLFILPQDIYTILRILKKFSSEPNKLSRGPQLCRDKINMDKIIVVSGYNHTLFYSKVLNYLFSGSQKFNLEDDTTVRLMHNPPIDRNHKININFENANINTYNLSNLKGLISKFCDEEPISTSKKFKLLTDKTLLLDATTDLHKLSLQLNMNRLIIRKYSDNLIDREMFIYYIKKTIIDSMTIAEFRKVFWPMDEIDERTKYNWDRLLTQDKTNFENLKKNMIEMLEPEYYQRRFLMDNNKERIKLIDNLELWKILYKDIKEFASDFGIDSRIYDEKDRDKFVHEIRIEILLEQGLLDIHTISEKYKVEPYIIWQGLKKTISIHEFAIKIIEKIDSDLNDLSEQS